MTMRVGALHTVPGLVPLFHDLLLARRDDLDIVHLADPHLLAAAIEHGVNDAVHTTIEDHLAALRGAGATSVLVTCSSIGEAAELAATVTGIPVVRVDEAMAHDAVRRALAAAAARDDDGGRVLVLATLDATLGPTRRLVDASVPGGSRLTVTSRVVDGAAAARAAGDSITHDRLIAEALANADDADVIVLAQASMAEAAGKDPRVLTSPASGAAAFVERIGHPA